MNAGFDDFFYLNKSVLVTGGTGSIGSHIVCKLLSLGASRIVVLGRTESKHEKLDQMIATRGFSNATERVIHRIGDIRDYQTVYEVATGCDIVFHVAAMKYVPYCEDHPFEAAQTNIMGAQNVRNTCINCGVDRVVVVSTDKAANPRGVMGMTKYIQEQLFLKPQTPITSVVVTRFGNVLGSEGSVVWKFKEQNERTGMITITDPEMRRFVMTPSDAANLVLWAGVYGLSGEVIVKRMKMCRIGDLAKAVAPSATVKIIGIRQGEKVEETLFNDDELDSAMLIDGELGDGVIAIGDCVRENAVLYRSLAIDDERMMTVDELRIMLVEAGVL